MTQVHRNDPCPCGSGKKHKKCCGFKDLEQKQVRSKQLFPGAYITSGASAKSLTNRLFKVVKKSDPVAQTAQENLPQVAIPS